MKYWHELSKKERNAVFKRKITYNQLMLEYAQPVWCGYPKALEGEMGCWSLFPDPKLISRKFCCKCDCYLKLKKIDEKEK